MEKYPFIYDIEDVRFVFDDNKALKHFKNDINFFNLKTPSQMLVAYLINNSSFSIFIKGIYCPNRYRVCIKGDNIIYVR